MPLIDSVDLFYLKMPEIEDVGDGSQDALLVRVRCGGEIGWGECEAAPLVSIAALVCPMSHSACHPVQDSVLGEHLDDIADIARIGDRVRARSLDLLQADHTLSGIDMALWDLLGRRLGEPVWRLLAATLAPSPSCPTPRSCSARRRKRPWRRVARSAPRAIERRSSAGDRSAADRPARIATS